MGRGIGAAMVRVLVTNDDGIDAPGLHHLARFAAEAGYEVTVAAPDRDASGTSASIAYPMPEGQLELVRRQLPGLAEVPAYAIAGSPALITLVAVRGAFGDPPDLVLSGVNRGSNTGHAILHSGTVGAALTAAANGCPAVALSLRLGFTDVGSDPVPLHWAAATHYLPVLLPALWAAPGPVVFNVNAPSLSPERLPGLRQAKLAAFGAVQTTVETGDGFVRLALESVAGGGGEPGTDTDWLAQGYATVSAVTPIFETPDIHLPDH